MVKIKRDRRYWYTLANHIIQRYDVNVFPNQLAELLSNWDWRYEQDEKKKLNSQSKPKTK
jgi:hypothetical protein